MLNSIPMYSMGSVTPWNKSPKYVIDKYRHGFGHSKKNNCYTGIDVSKSRKIDLGNHENF